MDTKQNEEIAEKIDLDEEDTIHHFEGMNFPVQYTGPNYVFP